MNNTSKFINFLVDAKKGGYTGNGRKEVSSRPTSRDYSFQKYDYYYLNSQLGKNDFIGQELIWQKENVFWGMNYNGQLLIPEAPTGFTNFLNEALSKVNPDSPFRGPKYYENSKFAYSCSWEGDIFSFKGSEKISYEGEEIFRLYFHGSYLK